MTALLVALLSALAVLGMLWLRQRPAALLAFLLLGSAPLFAGSVRGALVTTTLALAVLLTQPLFVVLGLITVVAFEFLSDTPAHYGIFPEKIFELSDKNVLLAIPFFVLAGAIMTRGDIARRLIDFARALSRGLPGGLALAGIGACVLFAAISGSSPVTVIAIGGMMYPALVKDGFGERPALGLLTSAGSLGIVIPPSIPMILYAIVVSGQQVVEVGDLFLAGVGPGLLIGALLAVHVMVTALRRTDDLRGDLTRMGKWLAVVLGPIALGTALVPWVGPWGHAVGPALLMLIAGYVAFSELVAGFWALVLPVLILGGIYSGVFSPTQAAAVAVVYALVVEVWVHRQLRLRDLPAVVAESAVMMGALILIMVIAFVFNDFLVEEQVPDQMVAALERLELSRVTFLLLTNVLLLLVGCFMDILSAILIVAPLLVPMAATFDVDPVHMGVIFIVNLELGYLTPPLGLNLFVSSTLFKKSLGEVTRSVLPYTAMMLIGIVLVTYVPQVALGPGAWLRQIRAPAQGSPTDAPAATQDEGPVLSIEELMRQAEDAQDTESIGTPQEEP